MKNPSDSAINTAPISLPESRRHLMSRLLSATVWMLLGMTVYESLKQLLFPTIAVWESHTITIVFSTSIALVMAWIITRKNDLLLEQLTEEIILRKKQEEEREILIKQLEESLSKVKLLSGMLPICASCKRIRDKDGNWFPIESYIRERSEARFTHGMCQDCANKLYPNFVKKIKR